MCTTLGLTPFNLANERPTVAFLKESKLSAVFAKVQRESGDLLYSSSKHQIDQGRLPVTTQAANYSTYADSPHPDNQ